MVSSAGDLEIILKHFDEYPLLTQKYADYLLSRTSPITCKARYRCGVRDKKEHLTHEGILKIVVLRTIKSSINKGLSDSLKSSFSGIDLVERPLVKSPEVIDPYWLAGFADGEGNFYIDISKSVAPHQQKLELGFN